VALSLQLNQRRSFIDVCLGLQIRKNKKIRKQCRHAGGYAPASDPAVERRGES
jgi:hypothetical protein